jgi:Uma2 family endonuclease
MSRAVTLKPVSVAEYLELEKASEVKHEYVEGMLFEMPGSSRRHNALALRIVRKLYDAAEAGGCAVYASDVKLRASEGVFYYPDVMVACADSPDPYYHDAPALIVEVLSPSTESTDRREKLLAYQKLPSLVAYVLVSADAKRAESYTRQPDGWRYQLVEETGEVTFGPLGVTLSLEELYRGLE